MLKQLLKKNKAAVIAWSLFADWRAQRNQLSGNFASDQGDTHTHLSIEESVRYIETVFKDYLTYGRLSPADLKGKRILELGPGDNFGVALMFLAHGARSVTCLDRFYCKRNFEQQAKIYEELLRRFSPDQIAVLQGVVTVSKERRTIELDEQRVSSVYGIGIEDAMEKWPLGSFDLIVSRAVMEHVYDADKAFVSMNGLLATSGLMLHKIDFRDHGMFSDGGHHPLTFLTIKEPLYRRMSVFSGRPNRKLIDYYRQVVTRYGYDASFWITHVVGRKAEIAPHKEKPQAGVDYGDDSLELIRKIRPRLDNAFRGLPDEDLLMTGVFLCARKR